MFLTSRNIVEHEVSYMNTLGYMNYIIKLHEVLDQIKLVT
jgi:hypothetical protein